MADLNGKLWSVMMLLLMGVSAIAMFLAGLGYNAVDKRLSIIECFVRSNDQRIDTVEKYQDLRLEKENKPIPQRPHYP